jgi:hypothetical protein
MITGGRSAGTGVEAIPAEAIRRIERAAKLRSVLPNSRFRTRVRM